MSVVGLLSNPRHERQRSVIALALSDVGSVMRGHRQYWHRSGSMNSHGSICSDVLVASVPDGEEGFEPETGSR